MRFLILKSYVAQHQRRLKSGEMITVDAHYNKRTKKHALHAPSHSHNIDHLSDEDKDKFNRMHSEQHQAHYYESHALGRKLGADNQLLANLEHSAKRHEEAGDKKSMTVVHNKIIKLKQSIMRHEKLHHRTKAVVEGIGKFKDSLVAGSGELKDDADKMHAHYVSKIGERFKAHKTPAGAVKAHELKDKSNKAAPKEPDFDAPQSEWDKYEKDNDDFYGKDKPFELGKTKTLEQQKKEHEAEKKEAQTRQFSSLPIAVKRGAEFVKIRKDITDKGGYVDGGYANKNDADDHKAYIEFQKTGKKNQLEALKNYEKHIASKHNLEPKPTADKAGAQDTKLQANTQAAEPKATNKENLTVQPYVYHATSSDNLENIKRNGLMRSMSRTNGNSTDYYHVSLSEEDSDKWANMIKADVQLRFKQTIHTKEGTYDSTRKHHADVKPWDLEIKTDDGKWKSLIEDKIAQPRNWFALGDLVNQYLPVEASFNHPKPEHIKESANSLGITPKDAVRAKAVYDSGDDSIIKGKLVPIVSGTLSGRKEENTKASEPKSSGEKSESELNKDDSPKEGDTKEGLVFRDGRWHRDVEEKDLTSRHAELDKKIDDLSFEQLKSVAKELGVKERANNDLSEAIKNQHPDDIDTALTSIDKQEKSDKQAKADDLDPNSPKKEQVRSIKDREASSYKLANAYKKYMNSPMDEKGYTAYKNIAEKLGASKKVMDKIEKIVDLNPNYRPIDVYVLDGWENPNSPKKEPRILLNIKKKEPNLSTTEIFNDPNKLHGGNYKNRQEYIKRDVDRINKNLQDEEDKKNTEQKLSAKENKEKGKKLLAEYKDAIIKKHGEKFGEKELSEILDKWSKWEPSKLVDFIEKFKKENETKKAAKL